MGQSVSIKLVVLIGKSVWFKPGEMGRLEAEKLQWMSDMPATKKCNSSETTGQVGYLYMYVM